MSFDIFDFTKNKNREIHNHTTNVRLVYLYLKRCGFS